MNKILDWLDESAAGIIRIAYLLAGVIAVAAYFGDGAVPVGIVNVANALLPWVLAGALEIHTYLTARRVRSAWQGLQAASQDSEEHRRSVGALKVNLGILAGLLAFSMWNQLNYLAQTWHPPVGAFPLSTWLAYVVRATIVPLAFMAAAFLVPTGESLTAQIKAEAHHFAGATFKVARQQWKARLLEMKRQKQDVTGALVRLIEEPEERRVVETIFSAMYPAVPSETPSLVEADTTTTAKKPTPTPKVKDDSTVTPILRLATKRPKAQSPVEQAIRRALKRDATLGKRALAKLADCSEATAGRYKSKIEREEQQPMEAVAR